MAGFFDKLMNLGAAHMQHVNAIRSALQTADTQAARDRLAAYLKGLSDTSLMGDTQGRQEFAAHCDVLAMQAQQLQQLQDNESSAWGTSVEDRMAYLQARLFTGQSDPARSRAAPPPPPPPPPPQRVAPSTAVAAAEPPQGSAVITNKIPMPGTSD